YVGQGFEIRVPFPELPRDDGEIGRLAEWFHGEYEHSYGRRLDGYEARVVTWWVRLAGPEQPAPSLRRERFDRAEPETRKIFLDDGWAEVPVFERARLHAGDALLGPLVVQDIDSTIVLP